MTPLARVVAVAVGLVLAVLVVPASVDPITLVQYVTYAGMGFVLIVRRPDNAIGWLLAAIGIGFITTTAPDLDVAALRAGSADAMTVIRAWLMAWGGAATYVAFLALAVVFPTGHLPTGRWRGPAVVALVAATALVVVAAIAPQLAFDPQPGMTVVIDNPFAVLPDAAVWNVVPPGATAWAILPVIALLGMAAVSLVVRTRQATGILRLQYRWLMSAITFIVVAVAFGLVTSIAIGETAWFAWVPAIVAFPTVPIAIGAAILRYRLLDIDRLISRTLAYALVTAILFGVFAAVNLSLQTVLGSLVRESTIGVAVSTLVVAALFQPLRVRLQRVVDRRFNRSRYDHEAAIDHFAAGLRDEMDVDRVVIAMRRAAERTVEPSASAVWRRDGGSVT